MNRPQRVPDFLRWLAQIVEHYMAKIKWIWSRGLLGKVLSPSRAEIPLLVCLETQGVLGYPEETLLSKLSCPQLVLPAGWIGSSPSHLKGDASDNLSQPLGSSWDKVPAHKQVGYGFGGYFYLTGTFSPVLGIFQRHFPLLCPQAHARLCCACSQARFLSVQHWKTHRPLLQGLSFRTSRSFPQNTWWPFPRSVESTWWPQGNLGASLIPQPHHPSPVAKELFMCLNSYLHMFKSLQGSGAGCEK